MLTSCNIMYLLILFKFLDWTASHPLKIIAVVPAKDKKGKLIPSLMCALGTSDFDEQMSGIKPKFLEG